MLKHFLERIKLPKNKKKTPFSVKQFLLNGDAKIIFDVGANVGQSFKRYRKHFPTASIYCFEPAPKCLAKLRKRSAKDPKIHIIDQALSNNCEEKTFHVNYVTATSSFYHPIKDWSFWAPENAFIEKETLTVKTSTIDLFCKEKQIDKIDILKIDAQGEEIPILKGACHMIELQLIQIIFCEVAFFPIYQNQTLAYEVFQYLHQKKYALFDLFDPVYAPNGQLLRADALFLNKQLFKTTKNKTT